ncbi:MAG: hypothetical protein E7386_08790 [Ruminococcaceae bacterium]|nr:hypothetical protein [Oscillospiraceae bacterium]
MNKTVAVAVAGFIAMVIIVVACIAGFSLQYKQRQTVSAYLGREDNPVTATVDLTGGYSCEFAKSAVYVYDTEIKNGAKPKAIAMTLAKEVYEEDLAQASADKNCRSFNGGSIYTADGQTVFIRTVGNNSYFAIFADTEDVTPYQMERFARRFTVEAGA